MTSISRFLTLLTLCPHDYLTPLILFNLSPLLFSHSLVVFVFDLIILEKYSISSPTPFSDHSSFLTHLKYRYSPKFDVSFTLLFTLSLYSDFIIVMKLMIQVKISHIKFKNTCSCCQNSYIQYAMNLTFLNIPISVNFTTSFLNSGF